jgi:hypothetical protein
MSRVLKCNRCGAEIPDTSDRSRYWYILKFPDYYPGVAGASGEFDFTEGHFCSPLCMVKWIYRGVHKKDELQKLINQLENC